MGKKKRKLEKKKMGKKRKKKVNLLHPEKPSSIQDRLFSFFFFFLFFFFLSFSIFFSSFLQEDLINVLTTFLELEQIRRRGKENKGKITEGWTEE